jgi:acetyl-CoA carboxylase biotin carboxylase subunit
MEMNARLQVEHPVTEMRTGVDLVREQLRIAANERLAMRQDQVVLDGASLECRINAEDPARGFQPTPGRLEVFDLARETGPGRVRVDTHLRAGDVVPPFYDSLLAKVIAWGRDRAEAIETMLRALRASRVEGVATTIPLHLAVLESEGFRRGEYDTSAIPGWPPAPERG